MKLDSVFMAGGEWNQGLSKGECECYIGVVPYSHDKVLGVHVVPITENSWGDFVALISSILYI
jgi:hypothetical protein